MRELNLIFPDSCLPKETTIKLGVHKEAEKLLNTIVGIYNIAIDALKQLKEGKLDCFDSLGTDCSCHLRALRIASISKMVASNGEDHGISLNLAIEGVLKELEAKKSVIAQAVPELNKWLGLQKVRENAPIVTVINRLRTEDTRKTLEFPLSDVLEHLNVKVRLDDDLTYIVKAYFMNMVLDYQVIPHDSVTCADCSQLKMEDKVKVYREITNTKKLLDAMPEKKVMGNLVRRDIYNKVKADLTTESVQNLLNLTEAWELKEIHAGLADNKREIEGRIEVPDFFSLTGAIRVLGLEGTPILLKVKKCMHAHRHQELETPFDLIMYLVPNGDKFVSMPVPEPNLMHKQVVVVVEGKRSGRNAKIEKVEKYAQRLTREDFLELCELDGAQHKQYTDSEIGDKPSSAILNLSPEKKEYLDDLQLQAELTGCSFNNQSLLVLSHILADTIENQLKDVNFKVSPQQKFNGCDVLFPVLKSKIESILK